MNSTFRIAFGCYELVLDRKSLTYSLMETTTQTRWAEELSVGWIELTERETGNTVRHEFSNCKVISISEKMSGTGKRILLGLDTPEGVPIDVYFTCAEKEIQLTVEASRDTKTHTLHRIGLLPGLCNAPDDGISHYVLPFSEGVIVFPHEIKRSEPRSLPVWFRGRVGLLMPFIGAVQKESALALVTDSIYASAQLSKSSCDWEYERDPERRRLEIRLFLLPKGDHISIAQIYRDKLINERAHVTLRKKSREKSDILNVISGTSEPSSELRTLISSAYEHPDNRWEYIEEASEHLKNSKKAQYIIACGDWVASWIDAWFIDFFPVYRRLVPLTSVVYRDSVIPMINLLPEREGIPFMRNFLRGLLSLSRPFHTEYAEDSDDKTIARMKQKEVLMTELYSLTFAAFLKSHQFLTNDFKAQEATYTDKTRVVVNFSESDIYSCEEFELPPLGFVVFHSQLTAYDALRVGEETFSSRELRIVRSGVE